MGFPSGASGKEPAWQCKRCRRHRFNPWRAWWATVHGVAKSQTQQNQFWNLQNIHWTYYSSPNSHNFNEFLLWRKACARCWRNRDELDMGTDLKNHFPPNKIKTLPPNSVYILRAQHCLRPFTTAISLNYNYNPMWQVCFDRVMVAQMVKHLPAVRETQVWSLGWEDPLEKEMATHSSTLAWKIPWTEEPVRLQYMGSQRVRHNWMTSHSPSDRKLSTEEFMLSGEGNGNPLQYSCLENPTGGGAW